MKNLQRALVLFLGLLPLCSFSEDLFIGKASVSITPELPVALSGQMRTRIAKEVESEVIASAVAIESRDGDQSLEQAIMVSCDLVAIRQGILEMVRDRVSDRLPEFDTRKIFVNATHSHTAPVMVPGKYKIPEGVTQPEDYRKFLADCITDIVVESWNTREPGAVGWGLGHAVVAHNRRTVYANGVAQMYGSTKRKDFREIEGYEDHGVEVLFFWNREKKLIATAINIACPSQEVEGIHKVSADFWHPVREKLKEKYGEDLVILTWAGASGDQSPHLMYRKAAEERMRKLRGLSRLDELARRIVQAWDDAYQGAVQEMKSDLAFSHQVKDIELPNRIVTEEEYQHAQTQFNKLSGDVNTLWKALWHQRVMERYELHQAGELKPYPMELHVIRLGDIAIATNPFELFTDYGLRMKTQSPALQTFVVQLTGPGTYLPTEKAVRGGGYSAIVESSVVGPEGGQFLVEETTSVIRSLWPKTEK
ncbi:MAG: hypothetical protein P1U89_25825 [Verrucomicrobiales bacterium]|nr:hypothetical protein [Verrucomicrobiales bacterium]